MSGRVESPYNRFQHAATNTVSMPFTTPIPLSRSGTGAEVLQVLRVSGEVGSVRPRRDSMDSFNSLHRFTQQRGTNGVSVHGQSAGGEPASAARSGGPVVPAARSAPPGIPRPVGTSLEAPPKNVWASAHFTHKTTAPDANAEQGIVSVSGPLNGTLSDIVAVTQSRDNRLSGDATNNPTIATSPVASAGHRAVPVDPLRHSQSSQHEDEVMTSYFVVPTLGADGHSSSPHPLRYAEGSPVGTRADASLDSNGYQVDLVDHDEWASQERLFNARRQPPPGTDPKRPKGGVPTMLRGMPMMPPRIPAINESVDVHGLLRQSASRAAPPPPPPQSSQPLYVVTREVLPATTATGAEMAPPRDVDEQSDGTDAEASKEDSSRIEPAAITVARRRASLSQSLTGPRLSATVGSAHDGAPQPAPDGERRASLRSVPLTHHVRMDEVDALVPQTHPPMPPSSMDTSQVSSRRSTPPPLPPKLAARAAGAIGPTAPPKTFLDLHAPIRMVPSPVLSASQLRVPTPSSGTHATRTASTTSTATTNTSYRSQSHHVVTGELPPSTQYTPSAERVTGYRTAGSATHAVPRAVTTSTATPAAPQPSHPRRAPVERASPSSSVHASTYTPAGTRQLNGSDNRSHVTNSSVHSSASGPLPQPMSQPAETTRVYRAAPSGASEDEPRATPQPPRPPHARRQSNTVEVPVTESVHLAPQDHMPEPFHAPLPALILLEAVVPRQPQLPYGHGDDTHGRVLHYQPRSSQNHAGASAPATLTLSTTTLTVEERKVRYLSLDEPFGPDKPDPTDAHGLMPMADTYALLHPSDYGRVLLANQPTVLAITNDQAPESARHPSHEPYDEDEPQQWAVRPTYMANDNHRWVRRSQRPPVATTHDPAGRAPEAARRLPRPPLTEAEARQQALQVCYTAFPAYQVTSTMTNSTLPADSGADAVHDAAGGFLLQRHVQQTATGKLLAGTPSEMPATSVPRPAAVSVPTSVGTRSESSTPASSAHSAPMYRPASDVKQGNRYGVADSVDRSKGVSRPAPPPRGEPTVRGSAEDARGVIAMTERLPAIPGYAHSGSRPPLLSDAVPSVRAHTRPSHAAAAAREYDFARPASKATQPPTGKTNPTVPSPEQPGSRPRTRSPSSQRHSHPPSQPLQPSAQHMSTVTGRPTSTVSGQSNSYVPSMASSARGSLPASASSVPAARAPLGPAADALVPSSASAMISTRGKTPSVRATSNDVVRATPATIGKPPQEPQRTTMPWPSPSQRSVSSSLPNSDRSLHDDASVRSDHAQPNDSAATYAAKPRPNPATATVPASAAAPARDTRPMHAPPPASSSASPATSGAKAAAMRPLRDYARPKPLTTAADANASNASNAHGLRANAPPSSLRRTIPPPPQGTARPPREEPSMELSAGSRSLTHSASLRRGPGDASEASFVSDSTDLVTEVQNHTTVTRPSATHRISPPAARGGYTGAAETRYTSTSPSLVQPSEDFIAQPPSSTQWHGVVNVPTVRNNSAPPVHSPDTHALGVLATNSTGPSITHEGREGSELAVFAPVGSLTAHMPVSHTERVLCSTTVHHSSPSPSTPNGSQLNGQDGYATHAVLEPASADTLPIPVSERGEEDKEDDLTKKVRPTTLIVDGEVYELPRHESEELYFVPDEEGDVYFDEQNQEFYPVEDGNDHEDEEDEYDEL